MNRSSYYSLILIMFVLFGVHYVLAQNPLIMDQFTADPTARVFEGIMYVYPSHDIPASPGRGRANWFVMEDYHVFSSENLTDWTDHGVILTQTDVPWLGRESFDMWAPDCVFRKGKYYFYFPTGGRIGVAIAERPYGPFKPEEQPINGARGIDPCVLIDKDGTAYLYYSMNAIFVAKLKDNMVELDSPMQRIANLPTEGLVEGPFVFERNGIYYLTYPHEVGGAERLEYATGSSPMGPFEQKGVIMDKSASGCWTNHHSIVEFKGRWYLFYHDRDLSPDFDKNRSIKADYLFFNEDGIIRKVTPTHRGVGISDALKEIQIDRYSAVSPEGVSDEFLDPDQKQNGWKAIMKGQNAWVQYNDVDFGAGKLSAVVVNASSSTGGSMEIRIDRLDGPQVAQVEIANNADWNVARSTLSESPAGIHDLFVILKDEKNVAIDWIKFE
jgi:hypothetical protein